MNIALDLRRSGGFGVATYSRNTVHALARLDPAVEEPGKESSGPGHRYILIGRHEALRDYRNLPPNFVLQPYPRPASSLRASLAFHTLLRRHRADLLHVPHLFKTPRWAPCPYVLTVHDVVDFLDRKPNQSGWQKRMRFALARSAIRHAAGIVAVSESTRADILRVFRLENEEALRARITVAYNAIDERLLTLHASEADRRFIAERYQVNYPFLLYVGSVKPHKNVVRVIEAFSALKNELKKEGKFPDLKLIIIGEEISEHPEMRRAAVRGGVQQEVRFLGHIPIEALRIFYDLAKIFVFPSLYEGFGLPPLEAMAQGTPVVTSNTSSLPEVVGDAAVMVNPENVFEIMHALHRVLLDQPLRDTLKQRGYEQAQRFSWDASAQRLLSVYERAVGRGGSSP